MCLMIVLKYFDNVRSCFVKIMSKSIDSFLSCHNPIVSSWQRMFTGTLLSVYVDIHKYVFAFLLWT